MKKLSRSPDRYSFQKNSYINRQQEKNEPVSDLQLEVYNRSLEIELTREADPEWAKDNLEHDLRTTDWILEKTRRSESYAQNLYAALCNREFTKLDVLPILKNQRWSCSWRAAGGIIAHMRQEGDYIDWYCSGIREDLSDADIAALTSEQQESYRTIYSKYVPEGQVTEEIRSDLQKLGWAVLDE